MIVSNQNMLIQETKKRKIITDQDDSNSNETHTQDTSRNDFFKKQIFKD